MKIIFYILLCLFFLNGIVYEARSLYKKISNFKIRMNAEILVSHTKQLYSDLLETRKIYHEAKFIDNESERQEVQARCIDSYNKILKVLEELSDPNAYFKQYLSEEQRKDLEETLSLPRYKLF